MHLCTCCTEFMPSVCWYWAGKSLLSTSRLCTLQAGDREVLKHWSGSGGTQPLAASPAESMCAAVSISWWPASGGPALLLLLHRHLFIICPSEFLPLLERRCSYHYFCLPCRRQALISLSASHWGLHKSSEVGQKLENAGICSCYLCLPHFQGIKPVCSGVTADTQTCAGGSCTTRQNPPGCADNSLLN